MSREWKPGDLALVDVTPKTQHVVFLTGKGEWFCVTTGMASCCFMPNAEFRPLVVIDPDTILPGWNGPVLSSLLEACAEIVAESTAPREIHETTLLRNLADAFDAVLDPKPPKPDEPQGLGAVVEDAERRRWVRSRTPVGAVVQWVEAISGAVRYYADIDAVAVLSEGVQP